MASRRSLAGVRIVAAPQLPAETLPRMDVAVFVGFAARGPLHCPVAVSSVPEFSAIFGEDAPLALAKGGSSRATAMLGPAVRAFFANGGGHCWIVRVAWTAQLEALAPAPKESHPGFAVPNRFAVPGVLSSREGTGMAPARAEARSAGSWSDGLSLAVAASQTRLPVVPLASPGAGRAAFVTTGQAKAGDLLAADSDGRRCFVVVTSVTRHSLTELRLDTRIAGCFLRCLVPPAAWASAGGVPVAVSVAPNGCIGLEGTWPAGAAPQAGHWVSFSAAGLRHWLLADRVVSRGPGQPQAVTGRAWLEEPTHVLPFAPAGLDIVTLDMRVTDAAGLPYRRDRIGLTADQQSAWWLDVPDDLRFRAAGDAEGADLAIMAERGTFPLTAASDDLSGPEGPPVWLPLGIGPSFGPSTGPDFTADPPLARDGLAHFSARLFADPALSSLGAETLGAEADRLRYLGAETRRLYGLHAALSAALPGHLVEASLIAVPDATHLGWPGSGGPRPDLPTAGLPPPAGDAGGFGECQSMALGPPRLKPITETQSGAIMTIAWSHDVESLGFVVERARRADFSDAEQVFLGTGTQCQIIAALPGRERYRVAAVSGGIVGPWSNVVQVAVVPALPEMRGPADDGTTDFPELTEIHRQLLLLAAASREWLAVLSLPCHAGTADALAHAARLRVLLGDASAEADGDHLASFGALYHPWVLSRSEVSSAGGARPISPDGYAAGVIAARAARRGAWIAPANEPLRDAVGVSSVIRSDDLANFQDAQVNIIRQTSRGILALAADTLCLAPELRLINVRRLLSLLRRLALRRGASFVFEPNGPELRRSVERAFSVLLGDLHRRGAFAGARPEESYSVTAGGRLIPDSARDGGQFIAELRVAPSQPLHFMTLRLSQAGERLSVVEEV